MKKFYLFNLFFLLITGITFAQKQQDYTNHAGLAQRIKTLTGKYPQLIKARTLTQTNGGKDIWMLTIGSSNADQ